jgi:hypothetical protein
MGIEKVNLRWKGHETNVPNTFRQLWGDDDFADVTLATADGQQIRAHKVIISLCSPFFKKILLQNRHPNPLIYLKGVSYEHLENSLKLIYLGQCDVLENNVKEFLAIGEDLGITSSATASDTGVMEETTKLTKEKEEKDHIIKASEAAFDENDKTTKELLVNEGSPSITGVGSEIRTRLSERSGLLVAVNSQHGGKRFKCAMCDLEFRSVGSLYNHKKLQHEGKLFKCGICNTRSQGALRAPDF